MLVKVWPEQQNYGSVVQHLEIALEAMVLVKIQPEPPNTMKTQHKKDWCSHCEVLIVICGTCGNNTCNAGYGIINGKTCTDCPSAYELFDQGDEVIQELSQR